MSTYQSDRRGELAGALFQIVIGMFLAPFLLGGLFMLYHGVYVLGPLGLLLTAIALAVGFTGVYSLGMGIDGVIGNGRA